MSKHFHDSRYYLIRAGKHAKLGVEEHAAPVLERVRRALGNEPAPEPTRLESVRARVTDSGERATTRARATVSAARTRVSTDRTDDSTADR